MNHDSLTFYKRGLFGQKWRWKYQAYGNFEQLGNGGEAYTKLEDAVMAAFRVCGLPNPAEFPVPLWDQPSGTLDVLLTRDNGFDVEVRFR